jgi:hypothetical protein
MLELRPNCEGCDRDLPPDSTEARICSYECTFCASCVEQVLNNVCPNCGGALLERPIRPRKARRPGVSLAHQPASSTRIHTSYSETEIREFSRLAENTLPGDR